MGLGRDREALAQLDPVGRPRHVNDLEPAARALDPSIDDALAEARRLGASTAMVSGSGPTVIGLFPTPAAAINAGAATGGRFPAAMVALPFTSAVRHN